MEDFKDRNVIYGVQCEPKQRNDTEPEPCSQIISLTYA